MAIIKGKAENQDDIRVLFNLLDEIVVRESLFVIAKLKIADILDKKPCTYAELARVTKVLEEPLRRVMRLLASVGIFRESRTGRVSLTRLGKRLRTNDCGFHKIILLEGSPWRVGPLIELLETVKTGKNPYYGKMGYSDIFEYLDRYPREKVIFDDAMDAYLSFSPRQQTVLENYDFSKIKTIVDVGGGFGKFLFAILSKYKHIHGILFDLPETASTIRKEKLIEKAGLASRCKVMAGDYFKSIPGPVDLCMMNNILVHWDDAHANTILRNCVKALAPGGRVLAIDFMVRNKFSLANIVDIEFLCKTKNGRARTEQEFLRLFKRGGLSKNKTFASDKVTWVEGIKG